MSEDGEKVAGLVPKLETEFNKLGLTLVDANGDVKDTFQVLSELAEVYPTLNKGQKAYYTELVAGGFRQCM